MTQSEPLSEPLPSLADIRAEIDRIDAAMHALLIERSAVVSDLIAVKKVTPVQDDDPARRRSAFRPAREASMMRAMIERHSGLLPLDTVESIWRVIISTFTYVQAPYEVIYAHGGEPVALRDVVRFHFGYTVPVREEAAPDAVVSAVGDRGDALGLVPMSVQGAWWSDLEPPDAPKIIARLPFVQREDHPAGKPCLVLANAPTDPEVMDASILSLTLLSEPDWPEGVEILAQRGNRALVSAAGGDAWGRLFDQTAIDDAIVVGAHAPMFRPERTGSARG
ncbi:MAG: chorismate mutase [Pseudomonadota bacterium]